MFRITARVDDDGVIRHYIVIEGSEREIELAGSLDGEVRWDFAH